MSNDLNVAEPAVVSWAKTTEFQADADEADWNDPNAGHLDIQLSMASNAGGAQ
jgi:hypothetical protein